MKKDLKSIKELNEILKNPLPNLRVPVYDVGNKGRNRPVKKIKPKAALSQRMDQLETKMDRIETNINQLAKIVSDGFKQVNTRLDYIVKANNLKDLPSNR